MTEPELQKNISGDDKLNNKNNENLHTNHPQSQRVVLCQCADCAVQGAVCLSLFAVAIKIAYSLALASLLRKSTL